MRSTNLVIILVLMNAMAGVVAVAVPFAPVPSPGGADAIQEAGEADDNLNPERQGIADSFVGGVLSVAKFLDQIRVVVFAGPEMLGELGAPGVLVGGFEAVVGFVVAIDVAEIISGRVLS